MRSRISSFCWLIFVATIVVAGVLIKNECDRDITGCGYAIGLGPIVFLMYGGFLFSLIPLAGFVFDVYKWKMLKDNGVGIKGRTVGTSISLVIFVWGILLFPFLIGF